MSDFVHLHCHSHYSLLKALPQIDALVAMAKKEGMTALALTDLGNMYGAIEFYEACKKAEIKPILGCELYWVRKRRVAAADDARPYHLVVLAENFIGYQNLMRLISRAALEGLRDGLLCVDDELLLELHAGLIALSGCLQGEIPQLVRAGEHARARERAQELNTLFGAGNFYLELQDHPDLAGQFAINEALQTIATETGIPVVVTRDVHYLQPTDAAACDIMECIGLGVTVDEHQERSLVEVDRSFGTAKQIVDRWRHLPVALANTLKIAERINLVIPLNVWHFPSVEITPGQTADEELRARATAGLAEKFSEITPAIKERLDYELDVIARKGYAPYFLAVSEYIAWARSAGIITTTRGSAAGSLVSYAIGIVTVNPLYFKLPFERFLNPHRPSPPDVDADFADDRRDEVIAYVTRKYGVDRVAQIITFGTMLARASVRDAGRALGYAYGFCDHIAKLIPFGSQGFAMTIARALKESPDLKKIYDEQVEVKRLLDIAQKIEGCARHTSIHAAGVVIAPEPLTNFTPVQYEVGGNKLTTQYEMYAVEKAGLLKMDFLGIRNLAILGNAVRLVKKLYDVDVDLQTIPWDDQTTFAMLARGETAGVFQLSGGGMTRYLKELRPTNIFDIMAMVALFRPGPMESIPEYIRRKHNPALVTYLDERLKKILDQSLGILVYQDDVMLVAIELAGYSWEEADKLRKAMGKKIPEEMAKQKTKFFAGCLQNGLTPDKVETLWQLIEPFAAYGFGRAHAASYAVVAYQTAYLKAHYPLAYMCAVLSAESDDIDKIAEIVHECERMQIKVLPPNVNASGVKFTVVKGSDNVEHIRFGLSAIKNVGAHITERIIAERVADGPFCSLADFLARVRDKDLNKKSLESLIKCGALSDWGERGELLANCERMLFFARDETERQNNNQASLFGGQVRGSANVNFILQPAAPASEAEKLKWEKDLIGLYFSSHPFKKYSEILVDAYTPLVDLAVQPPGGWVTLCGLVAVAKKKWTKNRDAMLNVRLEDLTGGVELMVFPKTFLKTQNVWEEGGCVCVLARRSAEAGDQKVFVEKAEVLTAENAAVVCARLAAKRAEVRVSHTPAPATTVPTTINEAVTLILPVEMSEADKANLKIILARARGATKVYVVITGAAGQHKIETGLRVAWTEELARLVAGLVGAQNIQR